MSPALTLAMWLCVSALTSLGLSFPFVEIGIYGRARWRPIPISFLPSFPHNQTLILFGLAVHSTLQLGMAMWPVPEMRYMKKCYVQILGRLLKGKSIPPVPIPPFLPSFLLLPVSHQMWWWSLTAILDWKGILKMALRCRGRKRRNKNGAWISDDIRAAKCTLDSTYRGHSRDFKNSIDITTRVLWEY